MHDNIVYLDAPHPDDLRTLAERAEDAAVGLDVAKRAAQLLAGGHSVRTVAGALLIAAVAFSKRESDGPAIAAWLRRMADTVEEVDTGPAIVGRA